MPMTQQEIPVVFDCQGAELIGMIHAPESIQARGLLAIVAGGPQYRGGVGRLQVQLARELAASGVPVMRFDYRGLGDSEGEFRGFQDVEADLAAAIRAFTAHVPSMKEIVLWGGCDAAAAIMINAAKFHEVTGIIVGNPWVHTEDTGDAVTVKHHYRKRIRQKAFWMKVLKLQYNPLPALATLMRTAISRIRKMASSNTSGDKKAQPLQDNAALPFVTRMRIGLTRFNGDMLLLMSGKSMVSKEFDELVASDPGWMRALQSPRLLARHDMPNADQTYSSIASRAEVIAVARAWMLDPKAPLPTSRP